MAKELPSSAAPELCYCTPASRKSVDFLAGAVSNSEPELADDAEVPFRVVEGGQQPSRRASRGQPSPAELPRHE